MSNQKTLAEQDIIKCAVCGIIGNKENCTHFEEQNLYVHDSSIEKVVAKNPIDKLLEAMNENQGMDSKNYRLPRDRDRLLRLLIMHYQKSRHLLKWDHVNEDWEEYIKINKQ